MIFGLKMVNVKMYLIHIEKFVFMLKQRNYDITYDIIDRRGHCDLTL